MKSIKFKYLYGGNEKGCSDDKHGPEVIYSLEMYASIRTGTEDRFLMSELNRLKEGIFIKQKQTVNISLRILEKMRSLWVLKD